MDMKNVKRERERESVIWSFANMDEETRDHGLVPCFHDKYIWSWMNGGLTLKNNVREGGGHSCLLQPPLV